MIYFAVGIFLIFILLDLPALIREKAPRDELLVYAVLSGITFVYLVQYALGAEVFSPIKELSEFAEKTLKLSYALWQGHS